MSDLVTSSLNSSLNPYYTGLLADSGEVVLSEGRALKLSFVPARGECNIADGTQGTLCGSYVKVMQCLVVDRRWVDFA